MCRLSYSERQIYKKSIVFGLSSYVKQFKRCSNKYREARLSINLNEGTVGTERS